MYSLALHLFGLLSLLGQPLVGDITAAEALALDNRRAVKSIYVAMRFVHKSSTDSSQNRKSEAKIWMDGDKLRADHIDHHPSLGKQTGRRYIECFNCERPGYHLTYPEVPHTMGRLLPQKDGKFAPVRPTFDPRLLGYVSGRYGTLHNFRLDSDIARSDRNNIQLTDEIMDGHNCQVVRYTIDKNDVRVAIWFDTMRGYHPIRFTFEDGNKTFHQSTAVDLQPVGNGLWYPRIVRFAQHVRGMLDVEETIEVTEVRINQPIPVETFSLKGMEIADGTYFDIVGTTERSWVWRDGKLIPYASEREKWAKQGLIQPPEPVPLVAPSRPRYWLYAAAAILVVAAILFLRRAIRPRPA
jgi:hypothetical protein